MINIIGGVALLIWALKLVRLGVTRGFGAGLRRALAASTRNKMLTLISGIAVTALLQSSMATIMMIASFAGQAMINASSALVLVLGADVGTTIVAQLLAFDLSWLSPVALAVGVFLFSFDKMDKAKNIGRILIGIGLVLLSISLIGQSAGPIKSSETLPLILSPLQNDTFLSLLVAALMTWLIHSSLATVLLLMSLASSGVLPVDLAYVMVLGVNVGGTIAPLVSTLRDAPAAVRVTAANMAMRILGVGLMLPLLGLIEPLMAHIAEDPGRQLVNFHMGFNILMALTFLPFTNKIGDIFTKYFPDRIDPDDPGRPKYLNEKDINTPAIALAAAERETLRMADMLQEMLEATISAFKTNDENIVHTIRDKDDVIDKLYEKIKHYMARLSREYMDKGDATRFIQILTFATNLEHAGDVIDKNLMPLALKKIRNQRSFSEEGFREIESIHRAVVDSVRMAQNVMVSGNVDLARQMVEGKESIRRAEIEASSSHIDRLREGRPETIATTSLHLDIIRDYRRINSYICTVAFPILEEKGQLRASRLKPEEK